MTDKRLQRRLTAWWVLIGVLTLLNFSAYFSDGDTPNDVLYRDEAAIVGFFFYMLILGVILLSGWGLEGRETFALRRPRSWGVALGLAVLLVFAMLIVAAALEPVLHAGEAQGLDPPGWDEIGSA